MPLRPPQVLALEVAADDRQPELSALRCREGRTRRSRSDQTPSVSSRKTSSMRSGSAVRVRPGAAGSAAGPGSTSRGNGSGRSSGSPGCRSSTEMSTAGPSYADVPQCIHRSVPSRRSRAGENWNAWSLRIESTRNFRHSRCLAPGTGHDRVVARPCRPCGRARPTGRRCTARRASPRRPTAGAGSGRRGGSGPTSRRP